MKLALKFRPDFSHKQLLKQLAQDWKSFFSSIKDYNNNPNKYIGKPSSPKYKYLDKNPSEIISTNLALRIREGKLLRSLSKKIKSKYQEDSLKFELPTIVQNLIKTNNIQQIRIKKDKTSAKWCLLVIYKIKPKEKAKGNNIMSIDLGLNNLATLFRVRNKV